MNQSTILRYFLQVSNNIDLKVAELPHWSGKYLFRKKFSRKMHKVETFLVYLLGPE